MKARVKATGEIVDGILIYYGSEGKGYLDVPVDHDIFDRYDLEEVELLEQPSLPDGLEEAAEKYRRESCNKAILPNIDGPMPEYGGSIKDAFIAGAEWQKQQDLAEKVQSKIPLSLAYANRCFENGKQAMKEQMLKEAVEIEVKEDAGGYPLVPLEAIELYDYENDKPLAKAGDKVRVIVIKED